MSDKRRAGSSRLEKMSSFDELVEQSLENKKSTLDRIGPRLSDKREVEISLEDLHSFPSHPFKVIDDEAMQSLADSIRNRGVLHPIVVRVDPNGGYQIISGHRRRFACEKAGLKTIPSYIVDMTDDEAIILMADANFYQRDGLLPSEKAKAYRMKSDAIKRHSGIKGIKYTIEEIGEGTKDSSSQIKRFIRLSYLNEQLLNLIDIKKVGIDQGVQLSYLSRDQQNILYELMNDLKDCGQVKISIEQAKEIRNLAEKGPFNREMLISILLEEDVQKRKVTLNEEKLNEYFTDDYTNEQIEAVIIDLLEKWKGGSSK